ncbi:elongation factor 1-alpha C-terminal domain-related protein [Streptomyces griseobrunneus]|uniref:elongation factor 1-alpha C-terminal domain-related protein n=1 Tax=Streptomyces microflavus TaxID=1919 RepID=UPI00382472C8
MTNSKRLLATLALVGAGLALTPPAQADAPADAAEVVFEPIQPLVVDTFKNVEGLSRIAFLDGNTAVMLGKVIAMEYK